MKKRIYFTLISMLVLHIAHAQWVQKSSGLTASQSLWEMSAPGRYNCYANVFDFNTGTFPPELSVTHDGGASWQMMPVDSLAGNTLFDVFASASNVVHVIGWDPVNGGSNVFKSKNGGVTWKREAANAYTNSGSFADNIAFFNPNDGVIFGDPVDGSFEIYTTHDKGKNWHRVAAPNIPAPMESEYGFNSYMEISGNTVWAVTFIYGADYNIGTSRLLQSDDQGETWYVRNSSLPIESLESAIKFRDQSNGFLQENGKLFRTTNGGSSFEEVNYSGTFFPTDIDFVKDLPGCWISTGGGEPFGTIGGSSITYDDGNSWITLDTDIVHTQIQMINRNRGFSGGIVSANGNHGVFCFSGTGLKADQEPALCSTLEFNFYPNPTSESFSLLVTSAGSEEWTLVLHDMQGRFMLKEKFTSNEIFHFGNNLHPGLYLAEIFSGSEKHTAQLMKQ